MAHVFGEHPPVWMCRCDCGQEKAVPGRCLRAGVSQSCGCLARERARETLTARLITHGMSRSVEHNAWRQMKARCANANHVNYPNYGARGITVCERWRQSFESFIADMGPRPPGHSIERVNNDGNYEAANCRWATRLEQNDNKRVTRRFNVEGASATLKTCARAMGERSWLIHGRIKRGWHPDCAIAIPNTGGGGPRHVTRCARCMTNKGQQ